MSWITKFVLTQPLKKFPPPIGIYEELANNPNFHKTYYEDKKRDMNNGHCVGFIPNPEIYTIYDYDYNKFLELKDKGDISNEISTAYLAIKKSLDDNCDHIVETPNGFHYYCKPCQWLIEQQCNTNKRNLTCGLDILIQKCYAIGYNSNVRQADGIVKNYKKIKWLETPPTKIIIDKNYNEVEILLQLCKVASNTAKKIKKPEITPDITITDKPIEYPKTDGYLIGLFHKRELGSEFTTELGRWVSGYEKFHKMAYLFKQLIGHLKIEEREVFDTFHLICQCDVDGYFSPNQRGQVKEAMVRNEWDNCPIKSFTDERELSRYKDGLYRSIVKRVGKLCMYTQSLIQMDLDQKDFGNVKIISPYLSLTTKSYWDGVGKSAQQWFNLQKDRMLWGQIDPSLLNSRVSHYWIELCDKLKYGNYGLVIIANSANFAEPKTREGKFASSLYPKDHWKENDWETDATWKDKLDFQNYIINCKKSEIYIDKTYMMMRGKLIGEPCLNDIKFQENKDGIPYLLPLEDAYCIDLRNGQIQDRKETDYFTHTVKGISEEYISAKKNNDRWFEREVVSKIMGNDQEKIDYLKQIMGFSITGDQRFHKFFIFHGSGRNGKGIMLETLQKLCKGYSTTVNSSLFCLSGNDSKEGAKPELMSCKGMRCVIADEIKEKIGEKSGGDTLDICTIKQITGGSTISGRKLYCDTTNFIPTNSTILALNQLSDLTSADAAIRDRLDIISFDSYLGKIGGHGFNEKDPNHFEIDVDLVNKINKHWGSVLLFFVEGSIDYYSRKSMRPMPISWADDTEKYFESKCPMLSFMSECLEKTADKKQFTMLPDLLDVYREYFNNYSKTFTIRDLEAKLATVQIKPTTCNIKLIQEFNLQDYGSRPKRVTGYAIKDKYKTDCRIGEEGINGLDQ
jgi:P4 family phage/plasmid primase-like protien